MTFPELICITRGLTGFTLEDVRSRAEALHVPDINLKQSMYHWHCRGLLVRLRRGRYAIARDLFAKNTSVYGAQLVEDLWRASVVYPPSYISMQTVLWLWGVLPERNAPAYFTAVTPNRSKELACGSRMCRFSHILPEQFWGSYGQVMQPGGVMIPMAEPHKALIDWWHCNRQRLVLRDFKKMQVNPMPFNQDYLYSVGSGFGWSRRVQRVFHAWRLYRAWSEGVQYDWRWRPMQWRFEEHPGVRE